MVLGWCVGVEPFSREERENYGKGLYTGGRGGGGAAMMRRTVRLGNHIADVLP